jgi:hypothetical protein
MTHRFTRLMILSACAMLLAAVPASAALCSDGVSLTTYLTGSYSCSIGNLTFSNFSYVPSGSNPVPAADVTVDTLGPTSTGASFVSSLFPTDVGLEFGAPWSVPPGTSTDAAIGFDVTYAGGAASISDAGLDQTSGITGTGQASVVENGCSGAVFPCTQEWGLLTNSSSFAADTIFTPTGTISVSKDISVASGSNGTATISLVQDVFSTVVPEPQGLPVLLGFGLVAGLVLRKKFQSARG